MSEFQNGIIFAHTLLFKIVLVDITLYVKKRLIRYIFCVMVNLAKDEIANYKVQNWVEFLYKENEDGFDYNE